MRKRWQASALQTLRGIVAPSATLPVDAVEQRLDSDATLISFPEASDGKGYGDFGGREGGNPSGGRLSFIQDKQHSLLCDDKKR